MALVVKIISATGFIDEQNDYVAFVNKSATTEPGKVFHPMMDFISECKYLYSMLHAPTIYCEIVEQMWTSARYNSNTKTLTVTINGDEKWS